MALSYPSGATPSQPLPPSLCHHHTTLLFSSVALILSPQMILLIGFHGYAPHQHHHAHTHPSECQLQRTAQAWPPACRAVPGTQSVPGTFFWVAHQSWGEGQASRRKSQLLFQRALLVQNQGSGSAAKALSSQGCGGAQPAAPPPCCGCQGDHCHNIPWHSERPADRGENDLTRSHLK